MEAGAVMAQVFERSDRGHQPRGQLSTDCGPGPTTLARVHLRRLHPEPGELTPEEATTGLRFHELAPPDRPYLVLNMVATLDGRIAIDGRSGAIGNDAAHQIFHGLRAQADAV